MNAKPDASADEESWYSNGLRFKCTQCGNCCTGAPGVVWVTDAELEDIAKTLDRSIGEIRLFHTRIVGSRVSLKEFANGDCTFFDGETRSCQVYDARPMQCRTWPFWKSNLETESTWKEAGRDCPGMDNGNFVDLETIENLAAKVEI